MGTDRITPGGEWRKVYVDGLILGRRINRVSMSAEALFWRLVVSVDDYGNMHADPDVVAARALPRRRAEDEHIREQAEPRRPSTENVGPKSRPGG